MTMKCDLELAVGTAMTDEQSRVDVTKNVIQWQPIPPNQHVLRPLALLPALLPCRNFADVPTITRTPRDALARSASVVSQCKLVFR